MNISCSICAELFRGPDAHNLHVTRCGHVFHNECLAKWLERKNTCPECRSKTTSATVIRLFVNIVDSTYDENVDGPPDLVGLQNENDNLKFRLIEKDGAIKSKEDALNRLQEENRKLNTGQMKTRELILTLEHKLEQSKVITNQYNDQIRALKSRVNEIDHLREKLKEANEKNKTAELVQHLITGSQQETEELLKESRTMTELATMVTTLKRELRNCNAKRAQVRSNAEELSKQLKLCKDEKSKLEEKCSILESKLFQLESNRENKNDSSDRLNIIDNAIENKSPTEQQSAKRKFGEHLSLPRKVAKLETTRNVSPSMCVKASSIAGLSPLLKRTKSADLHKLSPVNDEKSETYSILKKPRLIQHHAKKSELRPLRLNKVPTLSSVDEASTSSSDPSQASKELPPSSLSMNKQLYWK
ncbi:E3 ubiquitin-protein ligase TRAIP-like isoform X2 [Sitodiplosis mosellana]|uniref:E3 ubiquitin-protein ligase TRAIP-like isoform X2 n=1 Tax=Sitodiplosis mosellana TaxID=263140 RepID=UPI002443C494|nr:E3 ubiquitin-protein ligase TRAIP-like isoform X2 [Sitodiplosis mosellana]